MRDAMGITTLLAFLLGSRRAILTIAQTRPALWVGAAFTLSAALAREYDGADLSREWWKLLIPTAVSLITSFLLFCVAFGPGWLRGDRTPSYRSFLTLYWMTAPLAWLYAIPFERFLDAGESAEANLAMLGLVALWRVLLMIRVVSALGGMHMLRAVFPVLLFGDVVLMIALFFVPAPVLEFMGGIRTPQEEVLVLAAWITWTWGLRTLPVWFFGTVIALTWRSSLGAPVARPSDRAVSLPLRCLAAASLAAWIPVLPVTQSEQRLRYEVERTFARGEVREALSLMSAHQRSDFPPHWEPTPILGYGPERARLLEAVELLADGPWDSWVRAMYMGRFERLLVGFDLQLDFARSTRAEEMQQLVATWKRLPEHRALSLRHKAALEWLTRYPEVPEPFQSDVRELLRLARGEEEAIEAPPAEASQSRER